MFRITQDPSSGSLVQYLVKNYKKNSIVSVDMDMVGVMTAYSNPLCVCVVHCIGRHCLPIQWTTVNYPVWSETCWSTFKYFIILILSINYILCISWIIKCLMGLNLPHFWGCCLNRRLEFVQSTPLSLSVFNKAIYPADFIRCDMGRDDYHRRWVGKDAEGDFLTIQESVRSPHRDPGKC